MLGAVAFLHSFAMWGKISTITLYLRHRFGFGACEVGKYLTSLGTCFLISEAALVPNFVPRYARPEKAMLVGLVAFACQMVQVALASSETILGLSVLWALLIGAVNPTLGMITASLADPREQGRLQGAIAGLRNLAEGISPFVCGEAFRALADTAFPGGCYLGVACVELVAVALATWLGGSDGTGVRSSAKVGVEEESEPQPPEATEASLADPEQQPLVLAR